MDDDLYVTTNPLIKAGNGLYYFWFTSRAPDYWPLSNTTLWIEWRLWGMNPIGYHVTNLALHIVSALLIWMILRRLTIPGAFLAALIFTVHPVNVESVAWISQRKGDLAIVFFLLSILWYLKLEIPSLLIKNDFYRSLSSLIPHPSSLLWYWLSLAAFLLAMLSKGSAAVLPVLLLLIIWWLRTSETVPILGTVPVFAQQKWDYPLRLPFIFRDLVRIAPFFVVAVAFTIVNIRFQAHDLDKLLRIPTFTQQLLGAGSIVWFYLYKAFLPVGLVFIYPMWDIQAGNPLWWLPLLAALAVTAVLWWYRKSWSRPFLFAWGFFCVSLAPVLGFTHISFMQYSLVADHYQQIAVIGMITLVTAGWGLFYQRARGNVFWAQTAVTVAATGILAYLTWQQAGLYRDAITLYQATLEKNPACWALQYNLGNELRDTGRLPESIEHFQQALIFKPDFFDARKNLAVAFSLLGQYPETIEQARQALLLQPDDVELRSNLGIALVKSGRLEDAIEEFKIALKLKPDNPVVRTNLGNVLNDLGRPQEAIEQFEQVLSHDPKFADAHINLGIALIKTGKPQEAIEHYQQALSLKPNSIEAHANLAIAYAQAKQSVEAVDAAEKAIQMARSEGRFGLAERMEAWLKSYRAKLQDKK